MYDSDPEKTFGYLLTKLSEKGIAYVQLMEPTPLHSEIKYKLETHHDSGDKQIQNVAKTFRKYFKGTLMCNNNLTPETALKKIQEGEADLVAFGRYFISNPDLPQRVKNGWKLAEWDDNTFYGGAEKGYTDY